MRSALFVVLAACGTDGDDTEDPVDCSMVTGVDTFTVGLEKMGTAGAVDFKLMSVAPAPPARGDNTWIVLVSSMSSGVVGAPMDGASIKVTPFMPAHQHGTGVTAAITPLADPGQYKLDPVNMWMQGVWEVTIRASANSVTDAATYRFCIP